MSKVIKHIDVFLDEAFNPRMADKSMKFDNKKDWGKLDYKENVKQMRIHKTGLQQNLESSIDSIWSLISQVGDLGHSVHAAKMTKHMEAIAKIANDVIKKYG